MSLKPTHVTYKNSQGRNVHVRLKDGTTWSQAKQTAKNLPAGAKPTRRK